ncbi:MAG: 2-oxoglutarate dehydrogenase E1 component [Gemmatimonadetes bacterium]|nr:2-oxoglutarate dehydrogenase E1 component [Gemmatimonadota bacterium]
MSATLFDAQNAGYVQALYELYARNPEAVPEVWRRFFAQGTEATLRAGLLVPDGLSTNGHTGNGHGANGGQVLAAPPARAGTAGQPEAATLENGRLTKLLRAVASATSFVQAFRDHGHMLARIDPLGTEPPGHPQLEPAFFGTTMEELEQIPADVVMPVGARPGETVAAALKRLQEAYSGWIGYEFEHLEDPERVRWLWDQVESGVHTLPLERDEQTKLLRRLSEVEGFEQFLHRAYLGQKRFSIEGTDMLVPMLDLVIEETAARGGRAVVLGMAHRGRLNIMNHVVGIGPRDIMREFGHVKAKDGALHVSGTGDVKYHHGGEGKYPLADGGSVDVILAPNPSHLEFVNPVVMGMARSMQHGGEGRHNHQNKSAVVPIILHGDAAFAGEGVVPEALNLGRLEGYTVGGTIHIIANNQVGFTTNPTESRSTRYSSDVAKGYDFPIIHVNADQPEACLAAVRLAMAYRTQYMDDVVIDLVGYRRHGHNEGDEPSYTQPMLYAKITRHATVRTLFAQKLVADGVIEEAQAKAMEDQVATGLRAVQDGVKAEAEQGTDAGQLHEPQRAQAAEVDTRIPLDALIELNTAALTWPKDFQVHPKLAKLLDKRREGLSAETKLEWAHAETLAFGSLLKEGYVIRLTGQDAQRGTFSQRHLVLHDPRNGASWTPLDHVGEGRFEVHNSPLTEMAVVGFEYGYSVATQRDLVLWEAQFGDFVNVAQVMIDQFISAGREKWDQMANLSMLLPHGYEGQGPEHSSARLERFLQQCAEDNMLVVYPTTPAQYFHLLRRQAIARPERPMIAMTPKSLLRLPAATSEVRELVEGRFQSVIDDPTAAARSDGVTRLLLCSGKVYYDLQAHELRAGAAEVAVARLEELYPFPSEALQAVLAGYPKLEEVVWVQEEPRNMGALTFVGPRLRAVVPRHIPLRYVARPERASTAEGKQSDHLKEQDRIAREALGKGRAGEAS